MKSQFNDLLDASVKEINNVVDSSFPSIYSKEDVKQIIAMLNNTLVRGLNLIEEKETHTDKLIISDGCKKDLIEILTDYVQDLDINDYIEVDRSSAEFELHGNCIELADVEVELHGRGFREDLKRELDKGIEEWLDIMNEEATI